MSSILQFQSIEGAVLRYRIMAIIVGVGLLVLTVVGIPIQVFAHNKTVVAIVGPLHGYLYLVYLVAAYDLARRAHFRMVRLVMMIAAGLVPFLAFVVEHQIMKAMRSDAAELVRSRKPRSASTGSDAHLADGTKGSGTWNNGTTGNGTTGNGTTGNGTTGNGTQGDALASNIVDDAGQTSTP